MDKQYFARICILDTPRIVIPESLENLVYWLLAEKKLRLDPGDVLLLHTDGVVQAWHRESVRGHRSPEADMFGQKRLANILERNGRGVPKDILMEIINDLDGFRRDDDATVVIIKRNV